MNRGWGEKVSGQKNFLKSRLPFPDYRYTYPKPNQPAGTDTDVPKTQVVEAEKPTSRQRLKLFEIMNNSNNDGFLAMLILIGQAVMWITSGTLAYDWVEPESFSGVILFIIVWGLLGKVFDVLAVIVIGGLAGSMR